MDGSDRKAAVASILKPTTSAYSRAYFTAFLSQLRLLHQPHGLLSQPAFHVRRRKAPSRARRAQKPLTQNRFKVNACYCGSSSSVSVGASSANWLTPPSPKQFVRRTALFSDVEESVAEPVAPPAPSAPTGGSGGALVPIKEESIQFTAGVIGGLVGFSVAGPVGGAIGGENNVVKCCNPLCC